MEPEIRAKIQEAQPTIDKAWEMLQSLCSGKVKWHMSIPARPNDDPDLVIADGLHTVKEILKALAAEPDEPTVSKSVKEWAINWLDREIVHPENTTNRLAAYLQRFLNSQQPTVSKSVLELALKVTDALDPQRCVKLPKVALDIQQFLDAQIAERDKRIQELENIAKRTKQFIVNGVELGYIRMPDKDTLDAALTLLPQIEKALSGRRGTP